MIVAVLVNSASTAFSILCCCKSFLISSSEKPRMCFLAQVIDVGAAPPPPPPGGAELGGAPGGLPENIKRDNLKILLESDSLIEDDSYIDLSKARNYLGEIEDQLKNLMND